MIVIIYSFLILNNTFFEKHIYRTPVKSTIGNIVCRFVIGQGSGSIDANMEFSKS